MRTARNAALRLLRLMMVASLALPAALFVYLGWASHREAWRNADERIAGSLAVLQEHASKNFQTSDLIMHEIVELTEGLSDSQIQADEERLHRRFAAMAQPISSIQSLWLIDADGLALVSDFIYPAPRTRHLTDRDYFSAQIEADVGTFIGEVYLPRFSDAQPFFSLSRRRPSADGGFNGVITVSLRPEDFETFYAQLAKAPGTYFSMTRADGAVLARFPPPPSPAERIGLVARRLAQEVAAGRRAGFYTAVAQLDGVERRFGFRRIAGMPVYLVAGLETAAVRSEWLAGMAWHLLFGLPASLLLFATLWMAMRRTRRLYEEAERREAAEAALRHAQRLEAIGQLTGGIAHDFNNLLMVISGGVERLRRRAADPQTARTLEMIATAADRGEKLTRQLLTFARRQTLAPELVDLGQRLPELREILQRSLRGDITVGIEVPSAACVARIDPAEFEIALINLAVNARDAMPNGGQLTIRLGQRTLAGGPEADGLAGAFLTIEVMDSGSGIPPEILQRVFDPFFTTKEIDKGTGLGLSQVYGFARQSGGAVKIDSTPGEGTTVTLYLPQARGKLESARPARASPGQVVAGLRVLLVEDNSAVADVTSAYFEQLGASAVVVPSPHDALDRLAAGEPYDLLFSDIVMPGGMSGLDLARQVRRTRPELPIVLATGYSTSANQALKEGLLVLRKPYSLDRLREALVEVFAPGAEGKAAAATRPEAGAAAEVPSAESRA
ncbi:ATP-binding protein [Faunimonas sp. B44]|uniref:ATP-binding protein n=1 Tax=Faunimonas sp. B44 TaxID=3461493 RepID=UPI004044591F